MSIAVATPSATSARSRRFTRREFHRMAELGIFGPEERLELADGEVVPMSPQGPKHISATRRTARQMRRVFGEERFSVREEKALALNESRERYPDVAVARGGDAEYDDRIAEAGDIDLVVEVSDTTLAFDREIKGREYAEAGIAEYWVVNLPERCVEVYRQPSAGGGYGSRDVFAPADTLRAQAAPEAPVVAADLLPLR
jgi:Uma2 family endonuclease